MKQDPYASLARHVESMGPPHWVVLQELTLGPTFVRRYRGTNGSYGRADLWACKLSWAKPCVRIFELKRSRADLLGDLRREKWRIYLPHAHQVFFAFPCGLAKPEEIPLEAGVFLEGPKGWSCARAPKMRPVDLDPLDLMAAVFHAHGRDIPTTRRRRAILRQARELRELGRELGYRLRQMGLEGAPELVDARKKVEERVQSLELVLRRFRLPTEPWALQDALRALQQRELKFDETRR